MLIGYFDMEPGIQQLVLDSKLESICAVQELIEKIKKEYSISEESFTGIWIALNEAVTNAIRHGNKFDPGKKVCLTVETKNDRYVCFTIKDEGAGFDILKIPDPTGADHVEEPDGRGVFLIKRLADSVTFSNNNGSVVEMCFDLYRN